MPEPPPRRERPLLPRDRDVVPFDRELVLRGDFDALAVERFAADPLDFAAPDERFAPAPDDFAREEAALVPLLRDAVERELLAAPLLARFAVEREPVDDLRAPLERLELALPRDDDAVPPLLLAEPSTDHLPDITRCAASATASAIREPNFVALAATLLAAWEAVSAASSPASRIFLRAAGLAAIAAAAAVKPAASISLLIAALASLSTVLSPEREREGDDADDELEPDFEELEREELLRGDFAIFCLPPSGERHFKAVPVP